MRTLALVNWRMFSLSELAAMARRFGEIDFSIKHAPYPQLPLEVALVEAVTISSSDSGKSRAGRAAPGSYPFRPGSRGSSASPFVAGPGARPDFDREIPPQEPARPEHAEPAAITPLRSMPVAEVGDNIAR